MSEFKIGPLNHVGVAVPNIEQACDTYRTLYGATDITIPFDMPEQGVKVCFVNLPNSQIELIEPLNGASPIANFLKRAEALGQQVQVRAGESMVEGIFEDIEDDGALLLQLPDGSRRTIRAGEVEIRRS